MERFVYRTTMPASQEELFAWHMRAGALERILPPGVRILAHDGPPKNDGMRLGERVHLRIRGPGLLAREWVAEHVALRPGEGFTDVQCRGPFRHWKHEHRMHAQGATRSTLEDIVEWELPRWAFAARSWVSKRLQAMFAWRHQRIGLDLIGHAPYAQQPRLEIVVGGASGLVGRALCAYLRSGGHRVRILVRRAARHAEEIAWDPAHDSIASEALENIDAVVHLGGTNISASRWNVRRKTEIANSRIVSTALLARTLARLSCPPKTFLCASAVSIYGNGDSLHPEEDPPGVGFLAEVARQWEAATQPAHEAGLRVCALRIGMVLDSEGGALAQMLPAFRWGMGGRIGSGTQWMSWIHLNDLLYAIEHLLYTPSLSGAVNLSAPESVRQREFARCLSNVLRRPALAPLPAWVVRTLLGEMGESLLLQGQRAQPKGLQDSGFRFQLPRLEDALRHALGYPTPSIRSPSYSEAGEST